MSCKDCKYLKSYKVGLVSYVHSCKITQNPIKEKRHRYPNRPVEPWRNTKPKWCPLKKEV